MIRFIWRNWWKNKERFLLLLVGALIISSGLGYLVGLSNSSEGTVMQTLQKKWRSSYDIVVRPPGTRSSTEKQGLLEPNYLNSHSGGISMKQYHQIQKIKGISIAAPISVIGYTNIRIHLADLNFKKSGIYREVSAETANNGAQKVGRSQKVSYFFVGPWNTPNKYTSSVKGSDQFGKTYGLSGEPPMEYDVFSPQLLVGIDPKAEAKLVGLNQAVLPYGNGRYFKNKDNQLNSVKGTATPVLIRNDTMSNQTFSDTFERLDLPFANHKEANQTMEKIKKGGGKKFLNQVHSAKTVKSFQEDSKEMHKIIVSNLTDINPYTGKQVRKKEGKVQSSSYVFYKASSLTFKKISSPFQKKWPFAYRIQPITYQYQLAKDLKSVKREDFRPYRPYNSPFPHLNLKFIGMYDPSKLHLSKDPLNQLPMETYRPPTAKLVLDASGNPVNPPTTIVPTGNPTGFMTPPPTMITTLKTAQKLVGKKPISAIRIKVAGVSQLNNKSQAKVKNIAKEIRQKTGLITSITLGSSPQPTLLKVPKIGHRAALGWIDEPWIKLGAAINIFHEATLSYSAIIIAVMLVAVMYVLATSIVTLLSRKKEFAVLLAVGWRPSQLVKMTFLESILVGSFVAAISWLMVFLALMQNGQVISIGRFLAVGIIGFLIYLFGAIWPARLTLKISPYETMQTGEITKSAKRQKGTKGLVSMAFSHFLGKLTRNGLSILAIAIPTALVTFFIFITLFLKGKLYTTWLGQYITVHVGFIQYIAMGIALLIAILTTAEIMWQNVAERQEEISLLKALGWRNGAIRRLILLEGMFSGLIAGIIGVLLAILVIWFMYAHFPSQKIWLLISCGIIPLIIGTIGAALPAEIAVRSNESKGMRQSMLKKSSGNWLVFIVVLVILAMFAGLALLITHLAGLQ